ncbi:MAG: PTS sugar transporter subunit IIB [Gemmatimonadetes bacterium]|nr:PTS sugar transporter subunit IIB [Gemmatimonadota bacterium]
MPIVLYRVDERLIHGQVVLGWGSQLRPRRYLVVDDQLAESGWEQELYRLGLADGSVAEFLTVEQAREQLETWRQDPVRSVLLTRDLGTMVRLAREGRLRGEKVNLGGIHHAPGRVAVLPYLYLNEADRERVRELAEEGADVSARDLPGSHKVHLEDLVDR